MADPKTYSILVIVGKPDPAKGQDAYALNACIAGLEALAKRNTDIRLLGESTILLPLSGGLPGVCDVVHCVESSHLTYTYTILTEDTEWHEEVKELSGTQT
jgi:hypothetical protein